MKALILGDIHGEFDAADEVIRIAVEAHPDITHIFQVGDLGDGWPGSERWNPKTTLPIHWLDGNHENHDLLEVEDFNPRLTYQPRGSLLEIDGYRLLWLGGATSIDKAHRTPHVSWWPQESIKRRDVEMALSHSGTIDAVLSHDRPEIAPTPKDFHLLPDGLSDRMALQAIHDEFQPRFWAYGHYHYAFHDHAEGTEFVTCPAIDMMHQDYMIWDGVDMTFSWK